jgi:hypothetical protein
LFILIFSRGKVTGPQTESVLIMQLTKALTHEFEQSDAARRIRLILSQLLFVVSEVSHKQDCAWKCAPF